MKLFSTIAALLLAVNQVNCSIEVIQDNEDSIKDATKLIAQRLWGYYTGWKPGDNPGNLPDPYSWWLCGAMFGSLIDYWYYTGDDTYNDHIQYAISWQADDQGRGPPVMLPENHTRTAGNDDQGFWALTAMSAAERKFKDPPEDQPGYLTMAQGVFNSQKDRWDDQHCGGGLRWQILTWKAGFEYKNTISNGCFFQLAARLASYTGDNEYAEWAEKAWDWMANSGLVTPEGGFLDGGHVNDPQTNAYKNCSDPVRTQWTYNAGVYLLGVAHMYNRTEDQKWKDALDKIVDGLTLFTHPEQPNILYESVCEDINLCNEDQHSFKAYLARWIGSTVQIAPYTKDKLWPYVTASAVAAAKVCSPSGEGHNCGFKWSIDVDDGDHQVGTQMAALEVIQNLRAPFEPGPVSANTGGTSKGDPDAGKDLPQNVFEGNDVTTGDRAGAGILTFLILALILGGAYFMIDPLGKY